MAIIRHILLYGIALAVIALSIKGMELLFYSNFISIQFFLAICAIVFLSLGIWIGLKPKIKLKESIAIKSSSSAILSTREVEVLELISKGLTNKEISDTLFISLNTTKSHISNIYSKLNTKNRVQTIELARNLEIL